jgi:hypothetical protein
MKQSAQMCSGCDIGKSRCLSDWQNEPTRIQTLLPFQLNRSSAIFNLLKLLLQTVRHGETPVSTPKKDGQHADWAWKTQS